MTDQQNMQQEAREQYRDAGNLNARIQLHRRFSTNSYSFYSWLVDRLLALPENARVLELGCGPGAMWSAQAGRVPPGWALVLSDFSPGMAAEARKALGQDSRFCFAVMDAQRIPFASQTFDAVIANHMLYHVPNRPQALAEVRRVLCPGGCLFAATNGAGHMAELDALIRQATGRTSHSLAQHVHAFGLDNGAEQLASWFGQVQVEEYKDGLEVTEVQPLIDYIRSMSSMYNELSQRPGEWESGLAETIESEIAARGAFHIAKRAGLFTARRT